MRSTAGVSPLETLDVALEGMFVSTDHPLVEHHLVHLRLTLPEHPEVLHLRGMVMRSVPPEGYSDSHGSAGMGIQLYGLGTKARRRWMEFFEYCQAEILATGPNSPLPSELRRSSPFGSLAPLAEPPLLFWVARPDVAEVRELGLQSMILGGALIEGVEPEINSFGVLAFVHPETGAEFHVPCRLSPAPRREHDQPAAIARFIGPTERIQVAFNAFLNLDATRAMQMAASILGPDDLVLIESPAEGQFDLVTDQPGIIDVTTLVPVPGKPASRPPMA